MFSSVVRSVILACAVTLSLFIVMATLSLSLQQSVRLRCALNNVIATPQHFEQRDFPYGGGWHPFLVQLQSNKRPVVCLCITSHGSAEVLRCIQHVVQQLVTDCHNVS